MKKNLSLLAIIIFGLTAKCQVPARKMADVVRYYSGQSDSVYVVNFWATYCKPCVAEIPFMQEVTKKYAGKKVKLLLVSLDLPNDYPAKIISFVSNNSITADVSWLDETDADHFCSLVDKKWSGSIPATIMVNAATGYKKFYEQEFNPEEFESELVKAVNSKKFR